MRVFAYYDTAGTIHSLITNSGPDGFSAMLTSKPDLFVAEVEGLQLKSNAPHIEELRKIAETHKIATPLPRCTLVRKGSSPQ